MPRSPPSRLRSNSSKLSAAGSIGQRIKRLRVGQDQRVELGGQSEDTMKIGDGQQALGLLLEPVPAFGCQTAWAMPVAAGTRGPMAALTMGALENIGPQLDGAAGRQKPQEAQFASAQFERGQQSGQEQAQQIPKGPLSARRLRALSHRTEPVHVSLTPAEPTLAGSLPGTAEVDQVQR